MKNMMKRFLMLAMLVLVGIALLACQARSTATTITPSPNEVGNFASYADIKNYLSQYYQKSGGYFLSRMAPGGMFLESATDANTNTSAPRQYSQTNNQVEGVSESDVFLTDGYTLFMIQGQTFRIVDVDSLTLSYEFKLENGYLHGMYYDEESKQVILIAYEYTYPTEEERKAADFWWYYSYTTTKVYIFDVSDHEDITIARELSFANTYMIQSRMIGGMLYLMLDNYQINYQLNEDDFVPRYKDSEVGSEDIALPAQSIFFMPTGNDYLGYLMLVSLDTRSDLEADVKAYIGSGYQVYMSLNNLYNVVYRYDYDEETQIYTYSSFVMRFEVQEDNTLVFKAMAQVEGSPLNQFSIDEYEGVLRIATTHRVWTNTGSTVSNQIFLLDATVDGEMTQLSKLGNLGKPGESIFAVRFNGEIGFVVTFVNTDPLYKISLADPYYPVVISEYEEPGVSDYLHIINDNLTLGVGRHAETIQDITRFVGVKVSLYNTAGNETLLKGNYLVEGTWSYTNVMYDHKAFIYYPRLDLGVVYFAIPIFEYTNNPSNPNYWNYSQNLYVFKIQLASETLEYVGRVSHMDQIQDPYYWYWFDSVDRAVMIENKIYTISQTQIRVHEIGESLIPGGHLILETPEDGRPVAEDSTK